MKKYSIRRSTICLMGLVVVLFLVSFLDAFYKFSYNTLLYIFLCCFIGLWGYFLVEKNVIMVIWIPTVVLFTMGRPVALSLKGEDWLYHGPEVTRYYMLLMGVTVFSMALPRLIHPYEAPKEDNREMYLPKPAQWIMQEIPLEDMYLWVKRNASSQKKKNGRPAIDKVITVFANIRTSCALFAETFHKSYFSVAIRKQRITKKKIRRNVFFKMIIFCGYVVTFGCYLITKIAEYIGMQGKTYLDYYLAQEITLPWIVVFLASLAIYFMCIMLAMARWKKTVCYVLVLNLLSTVPVLLIGQRNPFLLAAIFSALVVYLKNKEVWKIKLSKRTVIILMVVLIIGVLLLVMMMVSLSSSRNGLEAEQVSFFDRILNFIRDQGNTFEVICQGITHRNYFREADNHNYTFSAIVDYFKYGQLGNWILKTPELPGGNNVERALMSNDFAHKASFLVLGDDYLRGAGLGTSYVIEVFLDFGIIGLILINLFYVHYLSNLSQKFGKSLIKDSVFIYSLLKVFFIGRDNALIPFSGLMTVHFLAVVIGVYLSYYLVKYLSKKGIL